MASRPAHSTVVAYAALFVALGGSSYAAIQVTGRDVKNSSLTGRDVRNNSLTGKDVKRLSTGDITNGRLLAEDFAAGQLPPDFRGIAAGGALAGSYPDPLLKPDEPWHQIDAPGEPPFQGTWGNFDPTYYNTAGYYKDASGIVHLKGYVKRPDTVGNTIFVLPPGYRTGKQEYFPSATGATYLFTGTGGGVAVSPSVATQATLDGITWRACGEPNSLPCP